MSKLWEPNPNYDPSKPQSWDNMPYRRLYKTLTPEELAELLRDAETQQWETLDLRITQISEVPDSIGNLTSLQKLDLSYTQIREVPDSIGNLTNLQRLYLYNTRIHEVPNFIGNLTNLKTLYLSDTQIREVPDSIGNLTSLQKLSLRDTRIHEVPNFIGGLTNLQSLDLCGSKIREVPDFIGNLKNLKILNLCYCHLKAIPYSLVTLGLPFVIDNPTADNCINLTGVELDEGDLQLFTQPREVIEAYYRDKAAETVNECKVIFLGDGAAGKSSLIERMVSGTFVPGSLPTDGVKMTKWLTHTDDGKPFTLRFLDFGGQEIMHSMHRCFLTAHTVYVVVCESREDREIDGIASHWLETVKAFAPGCPVILALNKCDLNWTVSVNERDLRQRNPQLQCVLKTSAKEEPEHKFGVNRLLAEIMELVPGCINRISANRDMLAVKKELENMTDDYISSERYREICTKHHIGDESMQRKWLNYFRELGVVYFYNSDEFGANDSLEKVHVLNPEWLTNGIYRLILRTPESGFLSHKVIQDTLRQSYTGDIHDNTYTAKETHFILYVMREFEISHYIGQGLEMIPLKMPKTPVDSKEEFQTTDALHLRWEGAYLPNNLIHRLLIRKFKELNIEYVWRTGGRFRQTGGDCEALAQMNEKALDVYVSPQRDCRQYMETFRAEILDILSKLNLTASEIICCTVDGQEGYIPYEDVVQQYYDRRESIYIPGIRKYVNPAQLLRDTYYDWEQEAERYRQRMAYAPPRVAEPPEKSELEEEKTRAEIAQINADTEKSKAEIVQIQSETKKNNAEADKTTVEITKMNLGIKAAVAAVFLLAFLIWAFPDIRHELVEALISLLTGLL